MLYYDNEGRVYRTRKLIDGVNYNIYHTYDALGRVKSIKYPDNETVAYTYDTGGNLSAVGGYATFPDAAYDALGQPGRISYGNGVLTTLLYYDSANSRLSEISTTSPVDGLLQHYGYSYDENGNITSITDSVDPAKNQGFQYDLLNRMTQATVGGSAPTDLTYSRTGNITKNTRVGTSTWVYDTPAHPSAVKTAGTNSYTYDANGNMRTRNGAVLDYDYENRLIRITKGGATNTYVYDYTGARIKKTTPTSTTIYIGNLFEKKDGVETKHIFAGGRRIASKTGSSIYYFHPDHLGGLNVVTDNDGRNVQSNTYYPFGETRDTIGSDILQYKFTGQENDPESGLYYYGARFYDPVIGRFITPDSIVQSPGDPQTLNRYAYCRNNPIGNIDPTGHSWWGTVLGVLFGPVGMIITAAIEGQDISKAAALGLAGGFLFAAAGPVAGSLAAGLNTSIQATLIGTHIAAGMGTGALSAAVNRQDVLKGALIGGATAGAVQVFNLMLEYSSYQTHQEGASFGEERDMDMGDVERTSNGANGTTSSSEDTAGNLFGMSGYNPYKGTGLRPGIEGDPIQKLLPQNWKPNGINNLPGQSIPASASTPKWKLLTVSLIKVLKALLTTPIIIINPEALNQNAGIPFSPGSRGPSDTKEKENVWP